MMAIIYDFNPEKLDLTNKVLRRRMGFETANYLMKFQAELKKEFNNLGKPSEFSIDIGYRLALVKNHSDADILLTSGAGGSPTQIIEVAKDAGKTHPHLQKKVVEEVNITLTETGAKITAYDIQSIAKVFNIEKRPEYYYQSSVPGSPKQYSQAFVEWLVEEVSEDASFFQQARMKRRLGSTSTPQATHPGSITSGLGSFVPN